MIHQYYSCLSRIPIGWSGYIIYTYRITGEGRQNTILVDENTDSEKELPSSGLLDRSSDVHV